MVDRQIKLNAKQAGPYNQRQNLIDFELPAGLTVDMAKSYVNIMSHCTTGLAFDGVFDFELVYRVNGVDRELTAPNTALVRHCMLSSANKGILESIRRSDALRTNLSFLKKTTEDSDGMLYKQILPHRTRTNHKQSLYRDLKGEGVDFSRELVAPIQIPMSDLFNLGSAVVSTDFLGATKVHLEISPERFAVRQLFDGADSTDFSTPLMRQMEDITDVENDISILTSKVDYEDLSDSPYWVGMPVGVKYTVKKGEDAPNNVDYNTIIVAIEYVRSVIDDDNIADLGKLKITLRDAFPQVPTPDEVYSGILLHGSSAVEHGGLQFTFDFAEIVLQETDPVKMDGMVFSTYTLQETESAVRGGFSEQFICEPNAYNILALALNENDLLTQRLAVQSYRYRIDNEDSTDRDVEINSPLYHDVLSKYMINNGESLKSLVLHTPSATAKTNGLRYRELEVAPYMVSTLPITTNTKVVDLTVVDAGEAPLGKILVFKSIIKQL